MRPPAMLFILAVYLLTSGLSWAEDVDYGRDIKPLLREKCAACHGALRQEAGLRLDAAQLIRTGSDSGAIITSGDADASLLLQRVVASDPAERMPPEGEGEALNKKQIALFRAWIESGAPSPDEESVPAGPKDHWAYQVPKRPPLPISEAETAPGHPVDAFVLAAQNEADITPFPAADRATLLRRITFDLIGLPPTPEELHAFLEDDSVDAYQRVVDRLLQSPQYGERWARHWMDVWRYSDWDGYKNELRGSQRHIWRWRDWIVESLNADEGYDEMIREMLAADELAPGDIDSLRATGFLARSYHSSNRDIWLDATVEHTAKAFLGMTINCARCHDHKFDPILQTDYYAFRAIFEPHNVRIERLPGQPDPMKDGLARAFDAQPEAETFLYLAGNEKHPDKEHPLSPDVPEIFGELPAIDKVSLPVTSWFPDLRDFVRREDIVTAEAKLTKARAALDKLNGDEPAALMAADQSHSGRPPAPSRPVMMPIERRVARSRVRAAEASLVSLQARWAADENRAQTENDPADRSLAAEAARLERLAALRQAQAAWLAKVQAIQQVDDEQDAAKRKQADEKSQKEFETAQESLVKARTALGNDDAKYTSVGKSYPQSSTGRRSALARWITARENPLTARVAVNQIWMRHFGEPLVKNVFDFGLRSPRPVHADLLDWLAVELIDSDWSMKRLHRLIVTSDVYQQASSAETSLTAANRSIDPDNKLLWRANVQRLDAEVVRDSVLAVAGSLDMTTGGPDIDYEDGERVPRRSLYFRHAYEKQMTMLVLFDAANPTDCYRRSQSIVPQQALTLANSTLTLSSSRKLARRLSDVSAPDTVDAEQDFIQRAFEHVLSRSATDEELTACREFLRGQSSLLANSASLSGFGGTSETTIAPAEDSALRARENLVHVLMNHNDFVTVR